MKKLLLILSLFICVNVFGQSPIGDSLPIKQAVANAAANIMLTNAVTVRGGVQFGFFTDTTVASASPTKCKFYPNAVISTLSGMYKRNNDATRWVLVPTMDDVVSLFGCYTLITPGVVTWSGTGFIMDVTSAKYTINCILYNSPTSQVTLAASHATLNRIDVIYVNTSGTVGVLTGTPAVNPVKPQVDPSTQLELTSINVDAASTTPGGVTQTIIYDENTGSPTEWVSSSSLTTGSVAFNSTNNPFHLTINALVASGSAGVFGWTGSTPLSIANYTSLKLYIRLDVPETDDFSINAGITLGGFSPSASISLSDYGFDKSIAGSYQVVTIPIADFLFPGLTFDGLFLKFPTTSTAIHIDYVQLQGGIPTGNSPYLTNIFVRNDSLFQTRNGVDYFVSEMGGGGNPNSNIGAGFRLAVPNTNNIKTLFAGDNITIDSTTNANGLTISALGGNVGEVYRKYNDGIVVFADDFKRDYIGDDYTTAFPGTTATIGGAGLRLVGTPGNFVNYISRNYYTSAENFDEEIIFINNVVNGTAYGIGVGVKSTNTHCCQHNVLGLMYQSTLTPALSGKSSITANSTYSYSSNGSSTISSISAGDTIKVVLSRRGIDYYVTSTNITTDETSTHVVATGLGISPTNFFANNTSNPSLWFLGGDITVINWQYKIMDTLNADYCFDGNSITFGQSATVLDSTFAHRTFDSDSGIISIVNAGGGDVTQSVVDKLPELYLLAPRYVVLMIGGNDILFGVSTATWQQNLRIIRDSLVAHGIGVIHLAATPRNATNMTPIRTFIDTCVNFTTDIKILTTFDDLATGTALLPIYDAGDGVHLNNAGHLKVAQLIEAVVTPQLRTFLPTVPIQSLIADGWDESGLLFLSNTGWKPISAGGGGAGTVTSFSFTDANGFDGTVATASTTPALTLTTTVADDQVMFSNNGAIAGSTKLYFDNAGLPNSLVVSTTGDAWFRALTNNSANEVGFIATNSSGQLGVMEMTGSTFGDVVQRNKLFFTSTGTGGTAYNQYANSGGHDFYTTTSITRRFGITNAGLFQVGTTSQFEVNTSGKFTSYASTAPTNGKLLIGHTANGTFELGNIVSANSTVTITNNAGSIDLSVTSTGSGTYTPSVTLVTNAASATSGDLIYSFVGNVVTVSGYINIDPTATGSVEVSIPFPSVAGSSTGDLIGGTGFCQDVDGLGFGVSLVAAGAGAKIKYVTADAADNRFYFTFTYRYVAP